MGKMTITSADHTERGVSKRAMHKIVERKDKHIKARDIKIAEHQAALYEYGKLYEYWSDRADKSEIAFVKERKKVIGLSIVLICTVIAMLIKVIING